MEGEAAKEKLRSKAGRLAIAVGRRRGAMLFTVAKKLEFQGEGGMVRVVWYDGTGNDRELSKANEGAPENLRRKCVKSSVRKELRALKV